MTEDFLGIAVKKGSIVDSKNLLAGAKHGMVGEIIDEAQWKADGNKLILPDRYKEIFQIIRVNRTDLPRLKECIDTKSDLKRAYCVDMGLIGNALGVSTLKENFDRSEVQPIIDLRSHRINDFLRSSQYLKTTLGDLVRPDLRLITSGSPTVGSGGGFDYLTMTALDLDVGALTGTLTPILSSSITDNGSPFFLAGGNHAVEFKSSSPHNGDPTAGWTITSSQSGDYLKLWFSGTTPVEIHGFTINTTRANTGTNWAIEFGRNNCTANVHDMFICGGGNGGGGVDLNNLGAHQVYSNAIWGFTDSTSAGIRNRGSSGASIGVKNNLLYNCYNGLDGNSVLGTFVNNAAMGCTVDAVNIGSANGTDNIGTNSEMANGNWNSGSLNNTGATATDEFYLDDTESNFAQAKAGGLISVTDPSVSLMNSEAWTDERGPKKRETGASGPPVGTLSMMGVGR